MRSVFLILFTALLAAPAQPQAADFSRYGQLDSNLVLFTVTAAINAAGYNTDLDSPSNDSLRRSVRGYLSRQDIPSVAALKRYVRDHKPEDVSKELGQYISWALLSKGPPDFKPAHPDYPQPPDAANLFELPPLIEQFYKEADIATLYQRVQPNYEAALAEYTEPVSRAVLQVNSFLRNPTNGLARRRFQVFLELMGEPNRAETRVYLDTYVIVITPSPVLRVDEIRHHYLHYMVDYYATRFGEDLRRIRSLGDYALGSPILAQQYKDNFTELASESFIKALEARIMRKPDMAQQAMKEGFVLTGAFYDGLDGYVAQDEQMLLYFPQLVKQIDLQREAARLDKVEFVSKKEERTVQVTVEVKPPAPTGVAKTLEDGEDAIRARDAAKAKDIFTRALTEAQEKPQQARAYYGLARVAILDRDPETGDQLFRKVLDFEPDSSTKAWSLLYLGKLADSQGRADPARDFYKQVLAVPDLPDQVRKQAEQGMQGAFTRDPGPQEPAQ